MATLKSFVAKSHLSGALIRAVVRQIGGWEEFEGHADDITNHGIDGGFHGFIYYTDTVKFTTANKAEILAALKEQASDLGEDGVISSLSHFGCLKGYSQEEIAEGLYNAKSEHRTTIYNALAWYAGEEVARSYSDLKYSKEL
jgi:hypothetical protein